MTADPPTSRRHVGSTYRLQCNGIGFAAATALVPFLDDLGVETCYLSPVTRAATGSTHGYDVVDPTVLDPALGTEADFADLLAALDARGMGVLLDIVPNHMSTAPDGPMFGDVLRLGQDSPYAGWFDIAWDEQDGKVLLPVLGDPLEAVLARGELSVDGSGEWLSYFENRFPLAPGTGAGEVADVVERQHYRLADWRVANREVNYRRFFDINELIGVRQEDPEVFAASHELILRLLRDERIRGVRVDHVDGMQDPGGYLQALRSATAHLDPAPVIVVEKILGGNEALPPWPVEGTTGYEVANLIVGLFVDAEGAADLRLAATDATGDLRTFAERGVDAKRRAVDTLLPHQRDQVVSALARQLSDIPEGDLRAAVTELTAYLAVYRTYRRPGVQARQEDLDVVHAAAQWAGRRHSPAVAAAARAVASVVTGEMPAGGAAWVATSRWQQLSGPATAKGVEDTAIYDSGRLLAVCDVGADPDRPAESVAALHAAMADRSLYAPLALSATSTHDSKRGHDVRCRLAVLSEIADQWETAVEALDAALGGPASAPPDAADRRYLYETAVGAWPADGVMAGLADRLEGYAVKAAREAKRHSSWTTPDDSYEQALTGLARALCDERGEAQPIVASVVRAIECAGATNAIASVLLKATLPGVPDIYQGDDLWFQALVDPDNRRPLDAGAHAAALASLPRYADGPLLESWQDGRVKQFVLRSALQARRRSSRLFAEGGYRGLEPAGSLAEHVIAYERCLDGERYVVVVPRLAHTLVGPGRFPTGEQCWADTVVGVAPGDYRSALTGGELTVGEAGHVPVSTALDVLPVALLRAV